MFVIQKSGHPDYGMPALQGTYTVIMVPLISRVATESTERWAGDRFLQP